MGWRQILRPDPVIKDVSHLLEEGWTRGDVTVAHSPGGAITLIVESLMREAAAEGTTDVLTLPRRLSPVRNLCGSVTFRGTGCGASRPASCRSTTQSEASNTCT
ncbi:MAG: hypothetical protein Q4G40_09940 [Brachybacterium sp.]|nr:hypothetical protein [Brachybacterium sp.]